MIILVSDRRNAMMRLFILTMLLVLFTAKNGLTEIYKWKGADGSISYTDDIEKVPEKYRDRVEIKEFKNNESVLSDGSTLGEDTNILPDEDVEEDQEEPAEEENTNTDEDISYIQE